MHQKPFVGRALPGPAGELTALPNPLAVLGRDAREVCRNRKLKRDDAEKRGYLGKKGKEQKGKEGRSEMEKEGTEESEGHT